MEKKEWIEKLNEIILGNGIIEYPDDQDALQKDLEDFISKELDKAREEGYQKGLEDSYEDYDGRLNDPGVREKLGLSKLNK